MSLQLLSLNDIKQSITMNQAIAAMESAFIQLAMQQVQLPLRTNMPIDEESALTLTMPAYLAKDKTLGLKVVSIFPNNLTKNKPSITGFIMLLDAKTGEPSALMDAAFLTSLRTGAASGLATKYFSKDTARHLALIGSGAQALTQLEAIACVRDIKQVSIWSRNALNARIFAKKFEDQYDIRIFESVSLAVQDADIICTATSSTKPLVHYQDVLPHAHINAIGSHSPSMREIDNTLLNHAIVIADQREAVLAESGEIISAVNEHQLKQDSIIEIGHWLLRKDVNYKNQLTVFKSVGLAIQDVSIASLAYCNAIKNNLGVRFSLSE